VGILKQLGVLPGPQDPALTEVIADMAPMATARAVAAGTALAHDSVRWTVGSRTLLLFGLPLGQLPPD
jgi:hypothetical protein